MPFNPENLPVPANKNIPEKKVDDITNSESSPVSGKENIPGKEVGPKSEGGLETPLNSYALGKLEEEREALGGA